MALLNRSGPRRVLRRNGLLLAVALASLLAACALPRQQTLELHRWWSGLGPVIPHESFPADCTLCHVGSGWNDLRADFEFDHLARTGVALHGAHEAARCLRCHNDRGPVQVFAAQGCAGCHGDVHQGQLGADCRSCHQEVTWRAVGQLERHNRTRFPLVGVHAATACQRCHPGAEVGRFVPTDTQCVSCHQADLQAAQLPDHLALGWVDNCHRCHMPTTWQQAEIR